MWEVAIKTSTGKLYEFEVGIRSFMKQVEGLPVYQVPVLPRHIVLVEDLPFIHRDPFDRLLIATAKMVNITILTADENIQKYDVKWDW